MVMLCLLAILIMFFMISFGTYLYTFKRPGENHREVAEMKAIRYEDLYPDIADNIKKVSMAEYEDVETISYDGLKLRGKLKFVSSKKPVIIFFHGYKSSPFRDFSGGYGYSEKRGYNALLVFQRAHGESEGKSITFGIKESYDVISWVKWCRERFGENVKILLMGISMGASTVVMASGRDALENVKGIVADCGYSSPKEILCHVIKRRGLPLKVSYFFVRLGAKLFAGFDPEEYSSKEAVKFTNVPILLIHGKEDGFVPCEMSENVRRENIEKCTHLYVDGANHGLSYYEKKEDYENALDEFLKNIEF